MFAWSKEDVLNMKLPEEWTKGVFEISVEDPMSSLMVIWVCGEAARSADSLRCEIFVCFSPRVPSKPEKNILVLLR